MKHFNKSIFAVCLLIAFILIGCDEEVPDESSGSETTPKMNIIVINVDSSSLIVSGDCNRNGTVIIKGEDPEGKFLFFITGVEFSPPV